MVMARWLTISFLLFLSSSIQTRSFPIALPRRSIPAHSGSTLIKLKSDLPRVEEVNDSCSYTVTSCSSPKYTRDQVSLEFGDYYGNEVYVPRLDDPSTGTFEQCSTDTFRITGACTYATCFLYVRRYGRDGWVPDSVKISGAYGSMTFYFRIPLPDDKWYGYDLCHQSGGTKLQPSTAIVASAAVIVAVVAKSSSSALS